MTTISHSLSGRVRRWSAVVLLPALLGVLPPGFAAGPGAPVDGTALTVVLVRTGHDADVRRLLDAGLDVVGEDVGLTEVWLHGREELDTLRGTGLPWTDVDVAAQQAAVDRAREQEERTARLLEDSPELSSTLPTGRVSYRTLDEVELELHAMADLYPDRVKLFELPHPSLLGTTVWGVEISRDVHAESGKPVFLNTGLHHAREWPTVELTLEFAWDVLGSDGADARITALMEGARMIVVPVVNPDGFDISRKRIHEQKRKNCRIAPGQTPTFEECAASTNANGGVDPNRNYGAFWGGPGSSATTTASNYRGEAPYSEPEIRNIVELTAAHQVMVAIHNHTPDGRLLRAPSSPEEPVPADVTPYDALAQELGQALDWPAGPWPEIYYEASGVAEQHAYYTGGIFGFTTEATPGHGGLDRFHPPYGFVVDQYDGTGSYEGSSIREAFLLAWEAAADPALHSVITGSAPPGAVLTVAKSVAVDTSCPVHPLYPVSRPLVAAVCQAPVGPLSAVTTTTVDLASTLQVPASGQFVWHVQPSVRPSQYDSTHLAEQWTLSCAGLSGQPAIEIALSLERGGSVTVDMTGCPT